jgi:hypothetical protein
MNKDYSHIKSETEEIFCEEGTNIYVSSIVDM